MIKFFKWLFNIPSYGVIACGSGLYRKFPRTKVVQFKNEYGWKDVDERLLEWHLFSASESGVGHVRMPDRSFYTYSIRERDSMGEIKFQKLVDDKRKIVLEEMIKTKHRKICQRL